MPVAKTLYILSDDLDLMIEYILPFLAYLLSPWLIGGITQSDMLGYLGRVILTGGLLIYFWRRYELKFRISLVSLGTGLLIFLLWIGLEGLYPMFSTSEFYVPEDMTSLLIRLASSILIAPFIEEIFTRGFLNRYIIAKDWHKLPISGFTKFSFLFTVLFFGLSHNRWLPGILTGIILNLLLMKRKSLSECIFAHLVANAALSAYIIATQSWWFW